VISGKAQRARGAGGVSPRCYRGHPGSRLPRRGDVLPPAFAPQSLWMAYPLAAFVANTTNPGSPQDAELKLTVTLPSGPPLDLLGSPLVGVIAPGQLAIPLASFVVPGGVPNGSYLLEAALIDPARGISLARTPLRVVKQ
jgi:hypothetical protein